jgi:hypothetical protein
MNDQRISLVRTTPVFSASGDAARLASGDWRLGIGFKPPVEEPPAGASRKSPVASPKQ